uniref:Uncharacterized protein n=1 Tax=Arundo donax TaxID=35708 RepID=A0A0A8ZZR6_ARUDO
MQCELYSSAGCLYKFVLKLPKSECF